MSQATSHDVPFLDLGAIHAPIRDAILAELGDVVDASAFINGRQVAAFEAAFADWCGAAHAVGVASGLDALRFALVAAGIGPGDEVVVPAMTFVATWEAVSQTGATPVPADVSETDYCLDPAAAAAAVTGSTAALMPVHLFGQLADMVELDALAAAKRLVVVEDAAQAHGAERGGRRAGGSGHAAGFSFYPGKNLGAMGDAGALVTDDEAVAVRVRSLREHGQPRKYEHDEVGWTARLDTFQAVVLSHKLPLLDGWNEQRRQVANAFLDGLAGVGDLVLPPVVERSGHVWHLFVVRTGDPDGLGAFLRERGIGTGRHYPQPPHLSRAYADLGWGAGAFPVAEAIARECLSLPIFPGMTEAQVEHVIASVRAWFARG